MLEYLLCFTIGVIFTLVINYFTSIGYSVIMLKQTQTSCAALLLASDEGLQEVLHLKYLAMEEANKSQQNITAQKYIDQMNINSVKNQ